MAVVQGTDTGSAADMSPHDLISILDQKSSSFFVVDVCCLILINAGKDTRKPCCAVVLDRYNNVFSLQSSRHSSEQWNISCLFFSVLLNLRLTVAAGR